MTYQEFLARKAVAARPSGLTEFGELSPVLFPFQRTVVERAIRAGRYAMFLDTGLGKTLCQLEWARKMPGEVLILAPPAVAHQSVREGKDKLGMEVHHSKDGSVRGKVTITNYERMHYFDLTRFSAVVLDESSILKSFTGKTRNLLVDCFRNTPYRLACTATPSPNDHTELGNHAEFLGVMTTGRYAKLAVEVEAAMRTQSKATQLRSAKSELARVKLDYKELGHIYIVCRARSEKAERECAEWKSRFDILLRRDDTKRTPETLGGG